MTQNDTPAGRRNRVPADGTLLIWFPRSLVRSTNYLVRDTNHLVRSTNYLVGVTNYLVGVTYYLVSGAN